jgi:hypothetical protein
MVGSTKGECTRVTHNGEVRVTGYRLAYRIQQHLEGLSERLKSLSLALP